MSQSSAVTAASLVLMFACGGTPAPAPAPPTPAPAPAPTAPAVAVAIDAGVEAPAEAPPPDAAVDDQTIYGGLTGNENGSGSDEITSGVGYGYGRGGFGPGGGGSGWGTIGTGNYGRNGRKRTGHDPTLSLGQPNVTGDLDKAIVRRYVKRNFQKLSYCYEKALTGKPTLHGTVSLAFTIAPNGTVSKSEASGVDPDVSTCMASVVHDIEFPKPKSDKEVVVVYPLTLNPPAPTKQP